MSKPKSVSARDIAIGGRFTAAEAPGTFLRIRDHDSDALGLIRGANIDTGETFGWSLKSKVFKVEATPS